MMTRDQQEEIRRLRDCGEGYKRIAAMLGLSVNTVKSFCQRENAKQAALYPVNTDHCHTSLPQGNVTGKAVCLRCGKPVAQIPGRRKRLRRMRKGAAGARPNPQILPSCLLYCASLWYCAERSERSSMSVTPNKSTSKTAGVQKDQPMLTHDQFQRELSYRAAISVAWRLLENKLITQKEFVRIDAVLRRKFSPVWGGLYPDNG